MISHTHRRYFKLSLVIGIVATLFFFTHYARAQNPTGNENRAEQTQIRTNEQVQNRMTNLTANVIDRAKAATSRLEHIANRLDSRIVKLNAEGVDTTTAVNRLNQAKSSIGMANDYIDEMPSVVLTLGSENPRVTVANFRNQFRALQQELRNAHLGLTETVAILRNVTRQ